MYSLVMSLCSRDVITNTLNGSRLTGLTCSKVPGFWMIEYHLVFLSFLSHIFLHMNLRISFLVV